MSGARLTYRFGPLERRGLLGAVRGGQAALVGGGALLAIVLLNLAPDASGALMAMASFAGSCALALVPVGRRTFEEWVPLVAAFLGRRIAGRARFRSGVPRAGFVGRRAAGEGSDEPLEAPAPDVPPPAAATADRRGPLPRPTDRGAIRAFRAAADRGAGVPRRVVLAA